MQRKIILLLGLLLFLFKSYSQQKATISGYVRSSDDGEGLIGATVFLDNKQTGTVTNLYGFYSLTLPVGNYNLNFSYLGYQNEKHPVSLNENTELSMELRTISNEVEEVLVTSEAVDKNIREARMSVVKLTPKETRAIPVLLGEQDILKTIQLLPGVSSGTEGSSGFYVRGGGADQNLILLDEAPVYSASHLMGFFSVFNSDAIKDVELYKGNAPSEYGGRLSSVLDIRMNEGNAKQFSTSGGIGLLASRLTIGAPIVKDKGSFIITGRRSYADMFLVFSKKQRNKNTDLYFYDLNLKANYRINEKNRLYLSGYFGRDVFSVEDLFSLKWGNKTGTLRWNHVFGNRLFLNSSLIYSQYSYGFGFNFSNSMLDINSGIRHLNLKEDLQYYLNANHTLKFGFQAMHQTFKPGSIEADNNAVFNSIFMNEKKSLEAAAYLSHEWKLTDRLTLNYGLRYSQFMAMGPDTVYTYNNADEIINEEAFDSGAISKSYRTMEPRITMNMQINKQSSVKLSYARNAQYVHLLSNSSASLPTDVWIASSKNVQPQIADQWAAGYFRNFKDNMFESSVEVYYKKLQHQIDYQNGAQLLLNEHIESQLVFGKGRAYGAEFYIKKRTGKLTGWIGYTLSRTEKSIEAIDKGAWFPTKYDRTHDVTLVAMYQLNAGWQLSANWTFSTGNAVTFPSGKYQVDNFTVPAYTNRNGYRMPNYHRMDIGATYTPQKKRRFESSWNFSIYNVYAHRNAFSITFRENEQDPTKTEAVRMALFQMIPSVTYNFKF